MSTPTTKPTETKPTTPQAETAKRTRSKPAENEIFLLAAAKTPDGKQDIFVPVPLPEGFDLSNKHHRTQVAIRAAVKSALEAGGPSVGHYAGKKLRVAFSGKPFTFNAKVEEIKVTKIVVTEA